CVVSDELNTLALRWRRRLGFVGVLQPSSGQKIIHEILLARMLRESAEVTLGRAGEDLMAEIVDGRPGHGIDSNFDCSIVVTSRGMTNVKDGRAKTCGAVGDAPLQNAS